MSEIKLIVFCILWLSPLVSYAAGETRLVTEQWLQDARLFVVGEARQPDTDTLLYRELHYGEGGGDDVAVLYRTGDGELWAEKYLDYGNTAIAPDFRQFNHRFGEAISVDKGQAKTIQVTYRAGFDETEEKVRVDRPSPLVIDAGFDAFIQSRWERLVDKETLVFHYLAPSRQKTYAFEIGRVDCESQASLVCLEFEPRSWWLGVVVSPIRVEYDAESRRLMNYRGLGNIAGEDGDYLPVHIRYEYQPDCSTVSC